MGVTQWKTSSKSNKFNSEVLQHSIHQAFKIAASTYLDINIKSK
jgi:hypothetical protein